ncbi:penicillin acylase family protein [Maribacter algarum]|uniref:Penicillin acylase family protein n=1 Tax=Maribacter algarum (ex Zhang et al. 2020) TaxID=2578118 RepID=A0A5S3PR48_9FLAO|nr:penicillin acylase family protein [Maribacter algarum]TMM57099.1 penicillin acylase family protein [Maribacter algarum]
MKKLKKFGLVLLVIISVIVVAGVIFMTHMKPDYSGEKQLSNLSETVDVYYDSYGIPHIYGQTEEDAFRALGYVHAQDRLWQMELLRRIGRGGLSEVFGKDVLGTDKFFLSLGIDEASNQTVVELDLNTESVKLSQAYLDGINQFIEDGPTPIEFYLTGIDKSPFTLVDIHNTLGYMSFSFAQAHKTDPFLTNLKNALGAEYLTDLEIDIDPSSTLIQNHNPKAIDTVRNTVITSVTKTLESLHIPLFEGSNSWVIGPEKTKSGKVIFANDPHIGFAQPSVWYEAHVNTPNYEKYGYHLAGVPFPLLAHDRKLAYGMTMFENDDVDFYFEETNLNDSTQYKNGDGWAAYEFVNKSIKVKDAEAVDFTFKKTKRGPVLNGIANQVSGDRPISMWWTYTDVKNEVISSLHEMSSATDMAAVEKALPKIHAPGLNIMYGDAKGNVAWWATAKLYEIPDSIHTKFVQESPEAFPAERRYLPFAENPQAKNPPWNYVYSANNQPDSINGKLYPGYYLPENRAKRIVQLLEPKNDWDRTTVGEMITDVTSAVDPGVLRDLAKVLDVKNLTKEDFQILDRLNSWKGDHPLESVEATIFHRWEYEVIQAIFMDELKVEQFEEFLSTHMSKRVIAPLVNKPNSVWWDDVKTKDKKETQAEIVQAAFQDALVSLRKDFGPNVNDWTWDKVHSIEHGHPIGQVAALRSFFNVGPFPIHGSREVINNLGFRYNSEGYYKVGSGPSTRRVIDFSDIENSMSILPTGQSGNPFSKHYKDQAQMFLNGEFRKMMLNKDEIIDKADSKLSFTPQ